MNIRRINDTVTTKYTIRNYTSLNSINMAFLPAAQSQRHLRSPHDNVVYSSKSWRNWQNNRYDEFIPFPNGGAHKWVRMLLVNRFILF
jgi:hypothetical protein